MKKKFLHICLSESWGGLEMAVSRWNEILREHGHENFNICTPNSPLAEDLKQRAFPVSEWLSAHYFAPDFTWKLRKLNEEKKFDAIVLQNLRDLWIVSPAITRKSGSQLVGFAQMLLNIKKTDLLHRLVYKRLDHLLTLTDWQQQALAPYLPVEKEKYKTVPNFVDSKHFHPKRRNHDFRYQLGFNADDFVIGVIGRIDEQKGQLELLKAFSRLSDKYKKIQLVIVGEPTLGEPKQEQYFQHIKAQVEKKNLNKRVHFLGFQKDTADLCANLDLFVLPSHQETFGFVVVEAMSSGTLVLGTNAGGVPEILQHGECGYLCEPKSWQDLQDKIEYILENPQEREEIAQKGLARARQFYDRQAVYKNFMKTLGFTPK